MSGSLDGPESYCHPHQKSFSLHTGCDECIAFAAKGEGRCGTCNFKVCVCSKAQKQDMINHPKHYTQGKIEIIDFIEDQNAVYLASNVLKYVCRYRFKGTALQDLEKASWYLNRMIAKLKVNPNDPQVMRI